MQVAINPVNPMNTNVTGETSVAQIQMGGFAFEALSGKNLYKNLIRAIVREISCNALDAHVMAGNQHVPFSIHIPTALEPYFAVRDYGIGLDDEGVRNVYLTYFGSTKRNDNTQIGAWGLGSKSPLGYTDNFTVTAIKDGIERIYSVFKNEEGIPSISIICENPTKDGNGLEVRLAIVDDYDANLFKREAREVLRWFDVEPNCNVDLTFEKPEYLIEGLNGNINVHGGNSVVVHGNIAYKLDASMLNLPYESSQRKLVEYGIELFMPHGTVDYSMSREELAYKPATIKNITEALNAAVENLADTLAETFEGMEEFDAYIHLESLKHKSFIGEEIVKALKATGASPLHNMPVEHFIVDTENRLMGVKYMGKKSGRRGGAKFEYKAFEYLYPTNVENWTFYVNEETSQAKFDKKMKFNYHHLPNKIIVLLPQHVEKYRAMLNDKIGFDITVVSTLELDAPPKQVTMRNGATRKDVVYRVLEKVNISKRSWTTNYVYRFNKSGVLGESLPDGVKYYVPLKGLECERMGACNMYVLCGEMGINTEYVFGVTASNIKKLSDEWVNLFEVLEANAKILIRKYKKYGIKQSVSCRYTDHIKLFVKNGDDVAMIRKATHPDALNNDEVATLRKACNRLVMGSDVLVSMDKFENDVEECVNALKAKYPLLSAADNGNCNFAKHMVNYIKMVNQL